MSENLISIFARGNQELFHSAFLAWLLRPGAAHGLGDSFLRAVLQHLPPSYSEGLLGECEVATELKQGRSRFDIILRHKDGGEPNGVVFENKVKSLGRRAQLDQYREHGYHVAALALLPETFDAESRAKYAVISYASVRDMLLALPLDRCNGYQFCVLQYAEYLRDTLAVFDLLRSFFKSEISVADFRQQLAAAVGGAEYSDNDVRTFNYFYYYNLAAYLDREAPELCFGTDGYGEAEAGGTNTRWVFEKNLQGPPFIEAILNSPVRPNGYWAIQEPFAGLHERSPYQIAPRLEVWLYPTWLIDAERPRTIGHIMLGTWSEDLKRIIRETEPYSSQFSPRGPRHFHAEDVRLEHIPFDCMAERLRFMLALIYQPQRPV